MKASFIIFSICILFSCSQREILQSRVSNEIPNKSAKIIEKPIIERSLEKLSKPSGKINLPEIKKVGEFALIRNSEVKDEKGWMLPPYKKAETKMGFEFEPQIGEQVTIIPLKVNIEPFQLKISKVIETKNNGCIENKDKEFFWAIELEKIVDRQILETEPLEKGWKNQMPFGVFAIYPSVEFAKSLDKSVIDKDILPKNVSLKRVGSAIDLDNDNIPDLLSVNFCCGEPEKGLAERCPFICKKYYKRNNEDWKIFDIQDFQEIC